MNECSKFQDVCDYLGSLTVVCSSVIGTSDAEKENTIIVKNGMAHQLTLTRLNGVFTLSHFKILPCKTVKTVHNYT